MTEVITNIYRFHKPKGYHPWHPGNLLRDKNADCHFFLVLRTKLDENGILEITGIDECGKIRRKSIFLRLTLTLGLDTFLGWEIVYDTLQV